MLAFGAPATNFGLRTIDGTNLTGSPLFLSNSSTTQGKNYYLRPIVHIDSSVKILTDKDGLSAENARTIEGLE